MNELLGTARTWCVTGAAGFIGSHLLETLLRHGQRVVGLDNFATGHQHNLEAVRQGLSKDGLDRFTFVEGDIRDIETCRHVVHGVDVVLHQAALGSVPRSIADPLATHRVNVDGFVNMLLATRDAGVERFAYASSSSVYGDHEALPKVEDTIGTPLSPYAVSKRVDELYAQTFCDHYGLQAVGLRYFNVFGPRQDPNGAYAAVIPKWLGQLLAGERPHIHGDGETSRDFCYVENVVQANIRAALTPEASGVYNVAFGERTTLNELYNVLVEEIQRLEPSANLPSPVYGPFRPGDVQHSLADITQAKTTLSYAPDFSALDGLRETVEWYVNRYASA